jgi:serine/threonine protein kinase
MKTDLRTFLKSNTTPMSSSGGNVALSFLQRCQIAKEIANGLAWLHNSSVPVVHGNLKPTNVLVRTIII